MKHHKLAIFIAIILFVIPFFWLKPGEMNLGGDAGRLYFYDPYAFLKNYTLYNFISSGKGVEVVGYVFLPYTFLLFLFKLIIPSSTVLIAIFNGFALSTIFLSVYWIMREFLQTREFLLREQVINYSSIIAGIFYLLSQELMYAGWEAPLITQNQIFLNPLLFLLLLRYLLTKNYLYIIGALLISVVFSANFAFVGAPTFFAFYPLALVFLFCYIKYVRKLSIPYKGLSIGILLFFLLHSFHLFSEISSVFTFTSGISKAVFSISGAASRGGLDYFIAIASSTKVSLSWMSLNQSQNGPLFAIFIIFPLIMISGFYFNKVKTLLLTGLFFLVTLFFSTANITDTGFLFYKLLFRLPGFSMFRNFHGQWLYVFIFFYSLLFGQAIAIVSNHVSQRKAFVLLGVFFVFITIMGISFINGDIPMVTHKNGLRYAIRMDPEYEKVLSYFKKYPIDNKTIIFPLTGPGYQVIQGLGGGIYQGLPMFSYLTGKSDFAGFGSLQPYEDLFLKYMKQRDYASILRLFSILNIKQVFYNSDPFVYTGILKDYLYAHVSEYAPKDQNSYRSFIESLPINTRVDFGDKYHIYTIKSNTFLPHIFSTTDIVYTNNQFSFAIDRYINNNVKTVPVPIDIKVNQDNTILFGTPQTFLFELSRNPHLHKHQPFVSHRLDSISYQYVPLKEKFDLYRVRNNPSDYLDLSLLLLSKRIVEVEKFGESMPVIKKSWKEPRIWEIYRLYSYNSWEASLKRYERGMEQLIDWVSNRNDSDVLKGADRIKINEQLYQHQLSLRKSLKLLNRSNDEKKYLLSLVNPMFDHLFQRVSIPIYNSSQYYYILPGEIGDFSIYVEKGETDLDLLNTSISVNNDTLIPVVPNSASSAAVIKYNNYSISRQDDVKLTLNITPKNLVKNTRWNNSGAGIESDKVQTLTINNAIDEATRGLILDIPEWTAANTYLISFDYLTEGNDFIFSFYDKKDTADPLRKYNYKLFFEKILNSKTWQPHQSIVTAEAGSIKGSLQVSAFSQKEISKMYIKNLSITKIKYPTVIFKKTPSASVKNKSPNISFIKINPTKYMINVKNAKDPYGLVFLESFNNNWALIDPSKGEKTIMGAIFRGVGYLGKNAIRVFVKDDMRQEGLVTSYFNGEVKEGPHKNIFLGPSTLETWGKSAIADDRHSQTFGYANFWLISPEDMQGRSEYTLIIEMKNQKEFYIFGFVSIITLVMIIIYFAKKGFFNRAKNNK